MALWSGRAHGVKAAKSNPRSDLLISGSCWLKPLKPQKRQEMQLQVPALTNSTVMWTSRNQNQVKTSLYEFQMWSHLLITQKRWRRGLNQCLRHHLWTFKPLIWLPAPVSYFFPLTATLLFFPASFMFTYLKHLILVSIIHLPLRVVSEFCLFQTRYHLYLFDFNSHVDQELQASTARVFLCFWSERVQDHNIYLFPPSSRKENSFIRAVCLFGCIMAADVMTTCWSLNWAGWRRTVI